MFTLLVFHNVKVSSHPLH